MRILAWLLAGLGALLLLLGLLWFGYGLYVEHVVARSPATLSIVRTAEGQAILGAYSGGNQIVPPAPTPEAELAPTPPSVSSTAALPAQSPTATPTLAPSRPILPPTRLRLPSIAVDTLVVLADNRNMPQFKGVGWYIGSGYPGFRGNVVLFGHLNGEYETFARLAELAPGDEVLVEALDKTYRYTVTGSTIVPRETVEVMAPSRDSRVTLITCTGTFFPATRDYSHRLVVTALLAEEGDEQATAVPAR